jgi:hypothetical protein
MYNPQVAADCHETAEMLSHKCKCPVLMSGLRTFSHWLSDSAMASVRDLLACGQPTTPASVP